jgi:hypothetical protein
MLICVYSCFREENICKLGGVQSGQGLVLDHFDRSERL